MLPSVLIVSTCFVLWAIVHSLLASLAAKGRARRWLGDGVDRWYRIGYVLFALATFAPIPILALLLPDRTLYIAPAPWRWLMVAGQVGGVIGAAVAILQTGAFRFVGLAQALGEREEGGPLQVRGLYCYVRHPSYTCSIVVLWLMPVMTANLLVLFLLFTLYFWLGSIHEERRLVAEFGEAYREYQRHVPRLIPRLRRCYPIRSEEH